MGRYPSGKFRPVLSPHRSTVVKVCWMTPRSDSILSPGKPVNGLVKQLLAASPVSWFQEHLLCTLHGSCWTLEANGVPFLPFTWHARKMKSSRYWRSWRKYISVLTECFCISASALYSCSSTTWIAVRY